MNTYNIFDANNYSTILFHAIAEDDQQVIRLAERNNIDISGLTIELERENVKNEMRKDPEPSIKDALIH